MQKSFYGSTMEAFIDSVVQLSYILHAYFRKKKYLVREARVRPSPKG